MSPQHDNQNSKVFSAMKAMTALGIKRETTKPVLKRLLRLYDNKWELIEEDNYRTLADAIFEREEEKEKAEIKLAVQHDPSEPLVNNNRGIDRFDVEHDPPEPPLKKHHGIESEDEASSTMDNGDMLDMKNAEIPQSSYDVPTSRAPKIEVSSSSARQQPGNNGDMLDNKNAEIPQSSSAVQTPRAPKIEVTSSLAHQRPRNNGKYPITINANQMDQHNATRWAEMAEAHQVSNKHIKHADNTNVIGHAENVEVLESETLNHLRVSRVPSPGICTGKRVTTAASDCGTSISSTYDLASSACGSMKVALKYNRTFEQQKVESPRLDSVFQSVESKYRHLYNNVRSKFSLRECLKELCQSYVDLAGTPASHSPSSGHPGDLTEQHVKKMKKKMMSNGSGSSTSFMAAKDHPTSLSLLIPDISKETETVRISLVDEISGEKEPLPNFVYIPTNIVYQSAYVHVSLARIADDDCCSGCSGDCLSSAVPCECARDTGGEFAYTSEGLVKEEFLNKCILMNENPEKHHHFFCQDCPLERANKSNRRRSCKGHLIRRFIKECYRKCGCSMSCGNRVVQRGISRKLQVFFTSDRKGWGVRSLEVLPKGAFVCEYVGEVLTNTELFERNKKNTKDRHTYPVLLDADWGSESVLKDEDALCLDATYFGNVARFINHRCNDANLAEIPVEVENPDHHYYHLAFFTKREVAALEELTWDYGIDFDDQNHPIKAFRCCCGSASCRDRKGKRNGHQH